MQDELDTERPQTGNILMRIRKRVEECFKMAEKHFNETIPRAQILFDIKGSTGGQSIYSKKQLRFNRKLAIDNEPEYMQNVIPHEVAHFVTKFKYGSSVSPHGKEWKKILIEVFRVPPKVRHHMDVSKVKIVRRKYKYICAACDGKEYLVGKTKHLAVLRGNVLYCPKCGGRIFFDNDGQQRKSLKEEEL
jgi:SprT protein